MWRSRQVLGNFVKASSDKYKVGEFSFDDTDVYKTIEGASYLMQIYPDKKMDKYISILTIVAAAQEPDGYLYTCEPWIRTTLMSGPKNKRWAKEEDLSHELYNLGHMIEVLWYRATGKTKFSGYCHKNMLIVQCIEIGENQIKLW